MDETPRGGTRCCHYRGEVAMKPEILETYRMLANAGQQGRKSEAIRVLCDEIARLQKRNGKRNGFVPPTIEEIKAYAREIHVHQLSVCEDFMDEYEARGWMVGRVKMVDWKAAFRRWSRRYRTASSNGDSDGDPSGWREFVAGNLGAKYTGDYRHAPEYLRIEFARFKKQPR